MSTQDITLSPAIPKKGGQVYGSNDHTRYCDASRVCLHKVTVWAGSGSDSSGVDAYGMCGIILPYITQTPCIGHMWASQDCNMNKHVHPRIVYVKSMKLLAL
jgi:hypothetical protein